MALEEDLPEKPEDKTIPKYKQIDKRAGSYVIDWGHELHRQYEEWRKENESSAVLGKRPTPGGKDDIAVRGAKKTKTGEGDRTPEVDDAQMKKAFEKQSVGKARDLFKYIYFDMLTPLQMTIPQLRTWLQSKGMPVGGKKAQLVERVEGHFEQK